jgi:hypothetical protein
VHEGSGCFRDRGQLDDEVWPLDAVLSRWWTAPATRRGWRDALTVVHALLDAGAWYEPAITPGLVQARLGVALNLAGYTRRRLRGKRVLSLGSHVGLEVRMLSDWGATALGVDVNPRLV